MSFGFRALRNICTRIAGDDVAPSIAGINYDLWDSNGGGQRIVVTGTGLADVDVTVMFAGGGDTVPTIISQTSTSIVFVAPLHPGGLGTAEVLLNKPDWSWTDGIGVEYWSPAWLPGIAYYAHARDFPAGSPAPDPIYWPANVGYTANATGAQRPTIALDAFGPDVPGVHVTGGQYMSVGIMSEYASTNKTLAAVAKWTSTATGSPAYSAPLPLLGWGGGWNCLGASGGQVHTAFYPGGDRDAGAGLNDGNPHLIAGTTRPATSTVQSIYADGVELDATAGGTIVGVDLIFKSYGAPTFEGVCGALLMTFDEISPADIVYLQRWAAQQFGCPLPP